MSVWWSRAGGSVPFSFLHKNWILDVLDVLLVTILFYRLLILVRGTRAAQMFIGLIVLVVASLLARWFHLATVDYLATSLRTVWLITFVILFQPELRHVLSEFGRTRYFRSLFRVNEYGTIGEVVRAAEELAARRQGGLIVLERNQGLRNFVETGTRLEARVTAELMVSLFSPGSPLHDGALILRATRWSPPAASCRSRRIRGSPRCSARGTAPPSASPRKATPWPSSFPSTRRPSQWPSTASCASG
jgi:DNA integrity scanning protein DisA with diadenylate cyclase activity